MWKSKDKLKGLVEDSKKLSQPPRELPEIVPRINQPKPLTIKTELPKSLQVIEIRQEEPTKHPEHDVKQFEDAINNINIDVIHTEKSEPEFYEPKGLGEGYFSEIEHYLKNKDVNEVMDDILKKDFLNSMKDYHDHKSHGKTFYLHKEDLKHKLEAKMIELRKLEEKWHEIRKNLEDTEIAKKLLEKHIDEHSQHLKNLFKQVKATQVLEKEAPKGQFFKLRTGQELKNLNDLRKALAYITEEEFKFHVTISKNDFASWTTHSLGLNDIGSLIDKVRTKEDMELLLTNL